MTNREHLSSLSDDDLAEWLCKQIFADYGDGKCPMVDHARYHTVRNFLMMEYKPEEEAIP